MVRLACAAVLLSGCTLYFGPDEPTPDPQPQPQPDPTGERLERECISGVAGGELVAVNWDELFMTWGCHGIWGEAASWGPMLVGLTGCCGFPFEVELLRVQDAWAMSITNDRRMLFQFGTGFPQTRFEHTLDDVVRIDFDGDGTADYITSGDDLVRRGPVPSQPYDAIPAVTETTLLSGKAYQYLAVTDLGGSTAADIFYSTKSGELGLAIQTTPGVFTHQTLGSGADPQRPYVADVDGDGLDDVIGASPHVFIYKTTTHTLVQLPDTARAIAVGDVDADGIAEPVFLTASGTQVRRVVGLSTAGTPVSKELLNTTEAQALALADVDGDMRSDVALIHELGQVTSWLELRRAPSFKF